MKKLYLLLTIIMCIFLIGCVNKEENTNLIDKNVLQLQSNNQDVKVSDKMELLEKSAEVADSSVPFTQVKSFIPDEQNTSYIKIQDFDVLYMDLDRNSPKISGKLIYENNTEHDMDIRALFFQGDQIAKTKLENSDEYSSAIHYKVPPFKSVTIDIDIEIDLNGDEELTFFPLDLTANEDFYNGANGAIARFYLAIDNIKTQKQDLKKQSFILTEEEFQQMNNIFPIPSLIDENKEEIKYDFIDNELFLNKRINGLTFAPIPYDTTLDLILMDEFGNTSVLYEKVEVLKNENTFLMFSEDILKKIDNTNRQFILILNNRNSEMLDDLYAIDNELKPFSTTFNSIIEIYKNIK